MLEYVVSFTLLRQVAQTFVCNYCPAQILSMIKSLLLVRSKVKAEASHYIVVSLLVCTRTECAHMELIQIT